MVVKAIDYVKDNCFKGREFKDILEAKDFLNYWLDSIANTRIHGTTKQRPVEVFKSIEKPVLKGLTMNDFIFSDSAKATLNTNCHLSYKSKYYSAPYQYIGMELDVIEVNNLVKIYFNQKEIAIHPLSDEKGKYITNKEHYPQHKNISLNDILSSQEGEMALIGPEALEFFKQFTSQETLKKYDYRTISGILALRRKHDRTTINSACARAMYYGSLKYSTVRKICEKDLTMLPVHNNESYINEESHEMARALSEYTALIELGGLQ